MKSSGRIKQVFGSSHLPVLEDYDIDVSTAEVGEIGEMTKHWEMI